MLLAQSVDSLDQFPGQFQSPAMSGYVPNFACRGKDGWEIRMISSETNWLESVSCLSLQEPGQKEMEKDVPGVPLVS